MSSQHRATPPQWADQKRRVNPLIDDAKSSCILELRDRVEALEAAALGRHGEAAERAEPGPAASLVERVASAIYNVPHNPKAEARAAIREVAEWLNERDTRVQFEPDRLEPPIVDEAIGWIYDEIDPHA